MNKKTALIISGLVVLACATGPVCPLQTGRAGNANCIGLKIVLSSAEGRRSEGTGILSAAWMRRFY